MTFQFKELTPTRLIALGFVLIVLVGSLLLTLPFSSRTGEATDFLTCLFTATSATCVTGLILVDTYSHWSMFGQMVILLLIQVGGLGFITMLTMIHLILGKKIGLRERTLIMESAGSTQIGGVVLMVRRVLIGTLCIESAGAILLSLRFIPKFGFWKGIYYGVFHSVSAFCNAGFDLMGVEAPFSSLTGYVFDPLMNLTVCALIVIGGIGFLVWDDIASNRLNFSAYRLHSKLALTATAVLIVVGTALMWFLERNHTLEGMNVGQSMTAALFAAISPRTAGFNTVDLTRLSQGGLLLTILLMIVGGSSGSTAGGLKVTTVMTILVGAFSTARQTQGLNIYKRRIDDNTFKQAAAVSAIYLTASAAGCLAICAAQPFGLAEVAFEVFSAVSTVGLTLGITPDLNFFSQMVLIVLMLGGRVGSLTVALALAQKKEPAFINRPVEKIVVG